MSRKFTVRPRYVTMLLVFMLGLAACAAGGTPGYTTQQQTVDGITISLERPQQAELLKDYELFVTLKDDGGTAIDGATVFVEMSMPSMPMPPQQPIADGLGGGRYRLKNAFAMEGDWKVVVHASIAGKEHIATFDQPVSPPQ